LAMLGEQIAGLQLTKEKDTVMPDLMMIDRGYAPRAVQQFVKHARLPFSVRSSRGYSASHYRPHGKNVIGRPIEQAHRTTSPLGNYTAHNADYWREVTQRAFLASTGAPGGASLWGTSAERHLSFAEHVCAEVLIEKAVGQRETLYKWGQRPGHIWDWLDALVGCYVGAACLGLSATGEKTAAKKPKKKRKTRIREVAI